MTKATASLCFMIGMACLCTASAWADGGVGEFVLPEGDLPWASVSDHRVAFTRNGAFVVGKDEHWICDGGLSYAEADWVDWGTQIRRSHARDTWRLEGRENQILVTRGTLFSFNLVERFRFEQRAEIIPEGLRFNYSITPVEKRAVQEFGFTLHFPIAETPDAHMMFQPETCLTTLPGQLEEGGLGRTQGSSATLYVSEEPRITVSGRDTMTFSLLDDRAWNEPTYRIIGRDPALAETLSRGETATFSFDLLLPGMVPRVLSLGPGKCQLDPHGRITLRSQTEEMLTGGLALGVTPEREVLEQPQTIPNELRALDEHTLSARGALQLDHNRAGYDVEMAQEDETITATFRLSSVPDVAAEGLEVAMLVPRALSAWPPQIELSDEEELDVPGETVDDRSRGHLAVILYRDGSVLEMMSDGRWIVSNMTIAEVPYWRLSTKTCSTEDDVQQARLRLSMRRAGLSSEKRF